jgi:glucose/arabinose dehydrogenase
MTRAHSPVRIEGLEDRILFATLPAGFQFTKYVSTSGLLSSMKFLPNGDLFYTQKGGTLRVVHSGTTLGTPVVTVPVDTYAERGLECVELDPNFSSNGFFYLYYTHSVATNQNQPNNGVHNQVSRFTYDFNTHQAITGSEKVILGGIPNYGGYHNAGALHFGPDGMLYVSVGEAGKGVTAQDLSQLTGKILRIDADNYPNSIIPADNPYVNTPGARGEVWARGFRNPFTMGFKPGTNTLYVDDVGGEKWEEINDVKKGGNYGWDQAEGNSSNPAFTNPIYTYSHASGLNGTNAAVTGGVFYDGNNFPASYKGKYFFADFVNRFIKVLDPATHQVSTFASSIYGPMDLDVGPDGQLYAMSSYGQMIYRIKYVGAGNNRAPAAVGTATNTSGATPLTVNFDGSGSSDPDGDALTYSWDFGDGSTGTGVKPSHTYTTKGHFTAMLTVSDGKGGTDQGQPIDIHAGSTPPDISITLPAAGTLYDGGEVINFAGTATDAEDGTLPASAFDWSVVFHHEAHTHPFIDDVPDVKSGQFTAPKVTENDPVQFYRIHLTVTDSDGTVSSTFLDVKPHTQKFTLASNIAGIPLTLEELSTGPAPQTITGIVGTTRTLGAPLQTVVNGKTYKFVSWSDGGAASHDITTPDVATTYTATYQLVGTASTAVTGVTLLNADTDIAIGALANNQTINLNTTPHINLRAETSGTIGSIVFTLNGAKYHTENSAPYCIGGDTGANAFNVWNVAPGTYKLVVTPWSAANGTGTAGAAFTVNFTVTKSTTTVKAGLNATYFDNANLTGTTVSRIDPNINFGWGTGSPASGIGADTFSARWTGKIKPATTGTYTFYAYSDNGARVWVNGKLIIDDWTAHAPHEKTGTIALTAGVKYDIKVEYFDNTEGATMRLYWSTSGLAKQIVPGSALTTA